MNTALWTVAGLIVGAIAMAVAHLIDAGKTRRRLAAMDHRIDAALAAAGRASTNAMIASSNSRRCFVAVEALVAKIRVVRPRRKGGKK